MIEIQNKVDCTGCGACENSCPVDAISMQYDEEGFLYPLIDKKSCINCCKCEKVCPMKSNYIASQEKKPRFFAAVLKKEEELGEVSSGGVFWALVQLTIERNGVVYGVSQNHILCVEHARASTLEECKPFRKSKYIQSETKKVFCDVKRDLEEGKEVLFSGTGCQIAGLKKYLQKEYTNLVCCEVVCHGVPSKRVYKEYIEMLERDKNSKVSSIIFRDKVKGWHNNHIGIYFENGTYVREPSKYNLFHGGYLKGLYYRPSCGNCPFAKMPRVGDITLADYWQYSGKLKEKNCDRGISLVVCSTDKGEKCIQKMSKYLEVEGTSEELAIKSCRHLVNSPRESSKRKRFFELLDNDGIEKAILVNSNNSVRKIIQYKLQKILVWLYDKR